MTGTATGIVIICVVVVVALAVWLGLVARAARRPGGKNEAGSRCAGWSKAASTSAAAEASYRTATLRSPRTAEHRHHPRSRPRVPGGQSTDQKAPWTSENTAAAADRRAASLETWRVWRQAEGQRASSPSHAARGLDLVIMVLVSQI